MKTLFETTINKKDTCLSYALKRTGTQTSVEFVEGLEYEFDIIPVKETKLEVGDIIAWEKKEKFMMCATRIMAPRKDNVSEMKFEEVDTRFHIGVIENKCMISDLTRTTNEYMVPSIRKRNISLVPTDSQKECPFPDFVIRKKT
ncbi:hypothetical protein [Chryseobacterium lathyri]|uniref:Uncharacterized protein n=1 Tax=Chryseobacterium lathyri TaxID=395933 RepID=A0A511YFY7_9FLAO|nr:hypothetical protein [Chryseobacterium lathyri]GEN74108.1 hypothetical protein CLA01_41800 [Chryseobacterium lathyri]